MSVLETISDRVPVNATPRERFIAALERRPMLGRVPHFELVFFLTMEAFGKVHPSHRLYDQWMQMEEKEREMHRHDQAALYIMTAERFEHSAIFLHPNPYSVDEICRLIDIVREMSGDRYYLMMHGDATFSIPNGSQMAEFTYRIADEPDVVLAEAKKMVDDQLEFAAKIANHGGLDGFALCADYCFNTGPFLSPNMMAQYVTPFLTSLIAGYRQLGFYAIKHTDGNIYPILDQLLQANPHALHSLDPQAGVDIADLKRRCGKQVCLIGNVNCSLLDTGTAAEIEESTLYALKSGMDGGSGYIFSSSNCIYTGMPLISYETMLRVWRDNGNYN
jgi:uroporphyrinogen decarboxylase